MKFHKTHSYTVSFPNYKMGDSFSVKRDIYPILKIPNSMKESHIDSEGRLIAGSKCMEMVKLMRHKACATQ